MGISSKLNERHIYQLIKAALVMRRLQKNKDDKSTALQIHAAEVFFDATLDLVLKDVDEVNTERVILKLLGA